MTTRTTLILRRSWSVAAASMLVSVFALAAPAGAQTPPTCGEEAPTIVGTNGADLLVGTPGDDVIVGLGGRDVIVGKDGNDLLCGGRGGDLVSGNGGDDFVLTTTTCPGPRGMGRGHLPPMGGSATTALTLLSDCGPRRPRRRQLATTS